MRSARNWMILGAAGVMAACATAAAPPSAPATTATAAPTTATAAPAAPVATAARAAAGGYLAGKAVDMFAVMPPAPREGEARYENDRRIFRETRALEGTPRWKMATGDADLGTAAMLQHFSCSLDIELTPQQAPRLIAFLQRATRDAAQVVGQAKDYYKRQRPFVIDNGALCVDRATVAGTYDYPSGHTTLGWNWHWYWRRSRPSTPTPSSRAAVPSATAASCAACTTPRRWMPHALRPAPRWTSWPRRLNTRPISLQRARRWPRCGPRRMRSPNRRAARQETALEKIP